MTTCGQPLVLVGIREWPMGDCQEAAGHPPPHRLTTRNVAGNDVVLEWDGNDAWEVPGQEAP